MRMRSSHKKKEEDKQRISQYFSPPPISARSQKQKFTLQYFTRRFNQVDVGLTSSPRDNEELHQTLINDLISETGMTKKQKEDQFDDLGSDRVMFSINKAQRGHSETPAASK